MTAMSDAVIDVTGLTKRFGEQDGRRPFRHHGARRRRSSAFSGPNGSGKTTTIRMLCGLLTPDEGEGTCLGFDIRTEADRIKREVGYMTQKFSFYEDLTIRENLEFVARLYGRRPPRSSVSTQRWSDLGLAERANQLAGTLSGGWKQRLALAACIMHEPQLLLLDEPTAGVDPKARRDFWDEIHRLAQRGPHRAGLDPLHGRGRALPPHRLHRLRQDAGARHRRRGGRECRADHLRRAGKATAPRSRRCPQKLQRPPGVDQVAPFGATLHVVGSDAKALEAATRRVESTERRYRWHRARPAWKTCSSSSCPARRTTWGQLR